MVMNFYRQQELARRQEKIMLLLFFVASILLTILVTYAINFGIWIFFSFLFVNKIYHLRGGLPFFLWHLLWLFLYGK